METVTITGILVAIGTALLLGLLAALVTYIVLWFASLVVRIEERNRRTASAVVGALVALLSLLSSLT